MNDNRKIVKYSYYTILIIIFTLIISIITILYGYIYKKNIGTAFNTHLENALTSYNTLFSNKLDVDDIIKPSFIEIYMKNVTDEKKLLEDTKYKKYCVKINNIEIFSLKTLCFCLFIIGYSLLRQKDVEDFTNVSFSNNSNFNVLIISIIIFGFIGCTISIYLFVKFMKMRQILTVDITDKELLLLKQGLLYEKITDDIFNIEGITEKIIAKATNFNENIDSQIALLKGDEIITKNKYLTDKKINEIDSLKSEIKIENFYDANDGDNGKLPAPFNGGDNKYSKIYKHIVYMGIGICGLSLLMIIICITIIYKRAD
jgi:hypothetical protein